MWWTSSGTDLHKQAWGNPKRRNEERKPHAGPNCRCSTLSFMTDGFKTTALILMPNVHILTSGSSFTPWDQWATSVCPPQSSFLCWTTSCSVSRLRWSWGLLPSTRSGVIPARSMWAQHLTSRLHIIEAILSCDTNIEQRGRGECQFNISCWQQFPSFRELCCCSCIAPPRRIPRSESLHTSSSSDVPIRTCLKRWKWLWRARPPAKVWSLRFCIHLCFKSQRYVAFFFVLVYHTHSPNEYSMTTYWICNHILSFCFSSNPEPSLYKVTMLCCFVFASEVGSYVWSHLTNLLRSEDPMKQTLIESLPEDIISRDFESEFLKYSSYADYTVSLGNFATQAAWWFWSHE